MSTEPAKPPTDRPRLPDGSRIRGTYTIDRYIGSGRFADVYAVRHRYMGMQAMKLLSRDFESEAGQEAFLEAFLLSKVHSRSIVRVFDANVADGESDGRPYITMEFAPGGTLEDTLSRATFGLKPLAAIRALRQLADGLAVAHAMDPPIVHRDLKPANILVAERFGVKDLRIADFGLARAVSRLTDCVASAGTLLYTPPESLDGYETPASDVYSLGLIAFELLTGDLPFKRTDLRSATSEQDFRKRLRAIHAEPYPLVSERYPEAGPDLDTLVALMLERSEESRLASAAAVAKWLDAIESIRRHDDDEPWRPGPGRVPLTLGFQSIRQHRPRSVVFNWFDKAEELQPEYRIPLTPFRELISSSEEQT
ncbi:MAG: serine/threonine-protein kinase [Phycisphaerales bacterium]